MLQGGRVLDEVDPPGLAARIYRYFAYFTIQSNILVAATSTMLARDPARDGPGFRVARLAALVGITVTGLVHFVLLRPLLDLQGADWICDKLLHMVVPVRGRRCLGPGRPPPARSACAWRRTPSPGRWRGWAGRS